MSSDSILPDAANSVPDVDISVLFISYNRSDLLELTFRAVRERVEFGNKRVEYIVSDDGSVEPHLSRILSLPFDKHVMSDANRGLANNCNKGIAATAGSIILQTEDDCEFIGERGLVLKALEILQADAKIGIVQLSDLTPQTPHEIRRLNSGMHYRVFHNDGVRRSRLSWERPYSNQPHLKRRQFCQDLGPYKEGTPMSYMELDFKRRVACQTRWRVASMELPGFQHIGGSRSFNDTQERAMRRARLYSLPLVGPVLYRLRPLARRLRDWYREF